MYTTYPPTAMTNAPNESDCTSCHSGTLNPTTSNLANLKLTNTFTGGGYIPDSTYTLTLSYSQSGISTFGFEITVLDDKNAPAGTLTSGTGSAKGTKTVIGKTRQYLYQTSTGGSGSKSWTFTWKAPSTNVDTVEFYAIVNAANGDGKEQNDQIYAKTFRIGPSNLLPVATINVSKSTVCVGDTVTYYGSGTNNPTSYRWRFKSGNPSVSTAQNVIRKYFSTGSFRDTLWVENAKGESAPVTIVMNVVASPIVNILNLSGKDTTCEGDTILLLATGSGITKYEWTGAINLPNNDTIKVTKSGSYNVTASNAGGCSDEANTNVDIVFIPRPTAILVADLIKDTACEGDVITYTSTPGFKNYYFLINNSTVITSKTNSYQHKDTGKVTVQVAVENNFCIGTPSSVITKYIQPKLPKPVITCGNNTTSSVEFNWTNDPDASSYLVSEDTGKTWISPNGNFSHSISGLPFQTDVVLWVKAQKTGICTDGNIATQICTSLPCSNITYDLEKSDTLVCVNDSAKITLKNISLTNYAISYNGSAYTTNNEFWFTPTLNSQNLLIEIIDSNGLSCPPFKINTKVNVEVEPFNVYSSQSLPCDNMLIITPAVMGADNHILSLIKNDTVVVDSQKSTFSYAFFKSSDVFKVVTYGYRCKVESEKFSVNVSNVKADFTISNPSNASYTFTDITKNAKTNNQWVFGDGNTDNNKATVSHTYTQNGNYDMQLIVTDSFDCFDTAKQQIILNNVSVKSINGVNISVFPNPAKDFIKIETASKIDNLKMSIFDINGKAIVRNQAINSNENIDISTYETGIYTVYLNNGKQETSFKIIKTK